MPTLYVSDMDGTLLDSSTRIPPQAVEKLNRAISMGALFTVATARTPATLNALLRDVNLNLPAIVMTGASTWHRGNPANPDDTGHYSNVHHFHPETAREILNIYTTHFLPSFLYTLRDNRINIYHLGPLSELEMDFINVRLKNPFKRFNLSPTQLKMLRGEVLSQAELDGIWEESLAHIPEKVSDAVLFFAMQPAESGAQAFADLRNVENINPMFYFDTVYPGNAMIEAFPGSASKANAIKHLASQIGADRIVAFGDNRNDIPMLEVADVAVAVDNAIPEVKTMADVVIGNCNQGAVADFILNDMSSQA